MLPTEAPLHGALPQHDGTLFRVWAPEAERVSLLLPGLDRRYPMDQDGPFFTARLPDADPGTLYQFQLGDGGTFPDPASRFQPHGVHGPSMVVDPAAYRWHDDAWTGVPQADLVFYELHVGTFTQEGTYRAAQERLPYLRDLGVTAIELMPVADFPGRWNWGYDQAALFAPSRAYGAPDDLRAFVDAAHKIGLAVYFDAIYNHLGPDGAYAAAFAPFFTDRYHTPWGQAINLDDTHSDGVRRFFIDNALHWLREYHADGLRLDATHALRDASDPHFLAELSAAVDQIDQGPARVLIAEDHRNLNTLVQPRTEGGYGLDGVWADDLHHQLRNITAGDSEAYYMDYAGTTAGDIARTLRDGWYYQGEHSEYMDEPRGTDPSTVAPEQCVVFIQNHDQVGNRPAGNRLTDDIDLPAYHALSALLLFAPETPLLFMGQEWAAGTPFQFFTDHNDELGPKVTEGRKEEFKDFPGFQGEVPDPQDPDTFRRSKLNWGELDQDAHARTFQLYRDLLSLRPSLEGMLEVEAHGEDALVVTRGAHQLLVAFRGAPSLPLPADAAPVLSTEHDTYATDGHAPDHRDDTLHFHRPGAYIARLA